MTAYRSTTLALIDKHCARALDFAEAGTFRDTSIFQAGIAAHAILQAIGEHGPTADHREIAAGVVRQLVAVGRSFDGKPEPPMSPEQAIAGREIVLHYLATHPMPENGKYEAGLAVDKDWHPVPYSSPEAYYRAAIDVLEVTEIESDDGYPATVVTTTDWKSAWPTDASEVETVQLKGQAALAWAHYPDATVLRRRAVNLRTGAQFDADTVMDDEGAAVVAGWRADIGHAIAAAEARGPDGKRVARPGAGCMECPYISDCDDAMPIATTAKHDPIGIAMEWMLIEARRSAMLPFVKALATEMPIVTPGGTVGYQDKPERTVTDGAARALANAWFLGAATETEVGMVSALKLSAGAVDALAKTLYPFDRSDASWKANREALLAECIGKKMVAKFGVIE